MIREPCFLCGRVVAAVTVWRPHNSILDGRPCPASGVLVRPPQLVSSGCSCAIHCPVVDPIVKRDVVLDWAIRTGRIRPDRRSYFEKQWNEDPIRVDSLLRIITPQ